MHFFEWGMRKDLQYFIRFKQKEQWKTYDTQLALYGM